MNSKSREIAAKLPDEVKTLGIVYVNGRLTILANGKELYVNHVIGNNYAIVLDRSGGEITQTTE